MVVEIGSARRQLEQLALVGIVIEVVAQHGKFIVLQHFRQQRHQLPAHGLFVEGALLRDIRQHADKHLPDEARRQREINIRGNTKLAGKRHLQPLCHTGALHQHHFRLKRIVKPLALNDKLYQCFQHIQTI